MMKLKIKSKKVTVNKIVLEMMMTSWTQMDNLRQSFTLVMTKKKKNCVKEVILFLVIYVHIIATHLFGCRTIDKNKNNIITEYLFFVF